MKKAVLRTLSAFLLLGIGLSVSAGWISSVTAVPTQEPETAPTSAFWLQMLILADTDIGEATLCGTDGSVLQALRFGDTGSALTRLIPPGTYRIDSEVGTVEFSIDANAVISTQADCAWTDGEQLHLTGREVGVVSVICTVPEDGWRDVCIQNSAFERRQTLWADGTAEFRGVPYGSYNLLVDGEAVEAIELNEGTTALTIDCGRG